MQLNRIGTRYKLYISSIHEAVRSLDHSGYYDLGENSFRDVDVMGSVTEIREYFQKPTNKFIVIKVDDGTGVIECVQSHHQDPVFNITEADLNEGSRAVWRHLRRKNNFPLQLKMGDTIHVRGVISEFRGKRELKVHKIRLVPNVNEECHRVFEVEALYQNVYKIKRIKS